MLLEIKNGQTITSEGSALISISKDEKCFEVAPSDKQFTPFEVCVSSLMPRDLKYPGEIINAIMGKHRNIKTLISEEAMRLIYEICDVNCVFY